MQNSRDRCSLRTEDENFRRIGGTSVATIHLGEPPALPGSNKSLTVPGCEAGDETPHPPVSRRSTSPLGEVVDFPWRWRSAADIPSLSRGERPWALALLSLSRGERPTPIPRGGGPTFCLSWG